MIFMGIRNLTLEDIRDPKVFCEKALGIDWDSTKSSWPPKFITSQAGTLTENFTFPSGQRSLTLSLESTPTFPTTDLNFGTFLKYMYCYLRAFPVSSKKPSDSSSDTALCDMLTQFNNAIGKMLIVARTQGLADNQQLLLRSLRGRLDSLSRELSKAKFGSPSSKSVSRSNSPHNKKNKPSGLPPRPAAPPCVVRYRIKGTSGDGNGRIQLPNDFTLLHLVNAVCNGVQSNRITVTVGNNHLPLTTRLSSISANSIIDITVDSTDKSNRDSALKSNPGSDSEREKKKSDDIFGSKIQSKKTQPGKKKRISLADVRPKTTTFEDSFYGKPRSDSKIGSTVGAGNAGISETGINAGETKKTKNTTNQNLSGDVISPEIPDSSEPNMKHEVLNAGTNSAVANGAVSRESDKKRRDGTPRKHMNNSGLGKSKKTQTGKRKKKGIADFKPNTSPFEASSAHTAWRKSRIPKTAGNRNPTRLSESEVEVEDTQTEVGDKLRRYFYVDNFSDERHTIKMGDGKTVLDMKKQLGKERNRDYKMIDILFANKTLRNDIVIDDLEVGDFDLFVYFRKEGDIPLGTCKALQVTNEYEYEYEYVSEEGEEEENQRDADDEKQQD
jgi:hypothetical protein